MKMMKVEVESAARVVDDVVAEPLSPRSAMFVHTDSTYIVATIGFETAIDVDIFRENISNHLLHNHRFSSLLVGGEKKSDELRWVHVSSVNLDNHIIVPSINPKLFNTISLEANKIFVEDYIHSLTKTSMDTSNPPWDVHVLNLKTSEAESVGIFRFHHALGDGTSLVSLILSCGRQVSDPSALPTIRTSKKKKKEENVNASWKFILATWWWLQVVWNTTTGFLRCLATTFFLKDSDLIINADPEAKIKPRRIVYKTISLDDMKLVKNAMNATINDVALGITEAGLSQYLIRKFSNGDNKEEKKANSFIEKLRMTITMAVNLRANKGLQSLGDMKKNGSGTKARLGNPIGFVLLPVSLGSKNDPLDHVREAKSLCDKMKASFEAICNHKINEIATTLFGMKVASSMWLKYTSHVSVLFSNVPGPVEEIALFGHPMKFIAPSIYSLSTPVVVHFQSYVNKMTIILSVREDTIFMEDPHQLCDDIVKSLQLCKDEINL